MSFSATVRQLLIACPKDVAMADLAIVRKAINRWNVVHGRSHAAVMLPVFWAEHAAAEFGRRPQAMLNDQIVDDCDICLAIFANRLGAAGEFAESGTVDEIERLHARGKYVGILRSRRLVAIADVDLSQATRLEAYLGKIQNRALVMEYENDAQLQDSVEAVIMHSVSREQARAQTQLEQAPLRDPAAAEIWARIDSQERFRTYFQDDPAVSLDWFLVLHNTGEGTATDVEYSLSPAYSGQAAWTVLSESNGSGRGPTELLAGQEARFHVLADASSVQKMRCLVSWNDYRGRQESSTILRLT